ncbi:MAG: hypothetical protein VKP62_16785 [Candidatus Sericytochromatia bacterium]|nr:hypothetical protein [Candidatus Sericytochromatia bacterium]
MTEADSGLPETTEQALDLSKERLEASSTQDGSPGAGEQLGEAQAADEALEGQTTGNAQSGARKSDFSFVADPALRSALEASQLPADARAALKAWQADYTRKAQAAAEYERKAQAWEALESMPGARQAIADLFAQGDASSASSPKAEELVDLTQADNETIWKAIRDEAAKQAKVIAEQMLQERIIAPVSTRQRVVESAKSLYSDWQDRLDETGFKQAWADAVSHYGEDAFTPENTGHLFSPFLERAAVKRELESIKGKQAKDAGFAKRAISPAGLSTSATQSSQNSKIAPGDKKAVRALTRQQILERFGWSERDLNNAASQS